MSELEVVVNGVTKRLDASETRFIGRAGDCDIKLDDPAVSRRHIELNYDGDGWMLTDRSTYGTFVDGSRVATHRVVVRHASAWGRAPNPR